MSGGLVPQNVKMFTKVTKSQISLFPLPLESHESVKRNDGSENSREIVVSLISLPPLEAFSSLKADTSEHTPSCVLRSLTCLQIAWLANWTVPQLRRAPSQPRCTDDWAPLLSGVSVTREYVGLGLHLEHMEWQVSKSLHSTTVPVLSHLLGLLPV